MIAIQPRWPMERAWAWYNLRRLPHGCNFLPSTAVNSTEMWQAESFDPATIDRELGWATQAGFNSCRVFLQFLVWRHDPQGFNERLNAFLSIADRHAMSIALVLFDDCAFAGREPYLGPQAEPLPLVHNGGWTPSPGPTIADNKMAWPQLETYVHDVVSAFGVDNRVLFWDLYNEPGNSSRGAKSVSLLKQSFAWAREAGPTQPLTAGAWGCPDTDHVAIDLSDIVTFHCYEPLPLLQATVDELSSHGYPLVCTEWMARTQGSRIDTHLPFFAEKRIGCYLWGLVNGRTQTHIPWGSEPGAPLPDLWFHDLFYPDGSPYNPEEIDLIGHFNPTFNTHKRGGPA